MQWGIIGPGKIAVDFSNDLRLIEGEHSIVSILGKSESKAKAFASKQENCTVYTTIDDFLSGKKPDAVYIATPHPYHFESAIACLNSTIPVLCEKPLCMNEKQCQQLIVAAKSNNTFLMEGMWIRFLPGIKKAINLVNDGVIGIVDRVNASMYYKAPYDSGSRYFNKSLGGGSLLDLGIYPAFLAKLFLGNPETIKADAVLSPEGVDESCSVLMQYSNGKSAVIKSSLVSDSTDPATINGSEGTITILHPWFEKSPGVRVTLRSGKVINYPFQWGGHGLRFEIEETIECIRNGKIESELMPHSFSLELIKIIDEVRRQIGLRYEMFE